MNSNILAFAASNSRHSINKRLALYAGSVLQSDFQAEVAVQELDLNSYEMPIYSIDREQEEGIPRLAHDFRTHIAESDGVIISFAEHNSTFTAAFKNIFDWCSRIDRNIFQNKPTLLMATSPGGRGAQLVMEVAQNTLPRFGAEITSQFSFGPFGEHFDKENNTLITSHLKNELHQALTDFMASLPAQDAQ